MIRIKLSYLTAEEKEKFLSEMLRLNHYKIKKVSSECKPKGKSLYRRIYIDLIQK